MIESSVNQANNSLALHSLQGALGRTSGRSYKAAPRQLLQVDPNGVGTSPILSHAHPHISKEDAKSIVSIGKTITYENYLPLWKTILNVTSLKEFDTSIYTIFDRQNMLVSLYDEIIDSILHIIDRLDLSVEKEKFEEEEKDEGTKTDPVFGMKPVKPKDFQIFYNLVDFCQ